MRVSLFLLLCLCFVSSFAQFRWDVGMGASLNAPLPTKMDTSATGKPLFSPVIASNVSYFFSPHWGIKSGIMYLQKGASYGQNIPKTDTLTPVIFNGQVVGEIPTYYTGKVSGKMRLHYVEIPIHLAYQTKKFSFSLGPSLSFLLAGYDKGNVNLIIGDPTVSEPLTKAQTYNNFSNIHKFDYGISLGIHYMLSKRMNFSLYSQRSLRKLYQESPNNSVNLYHTNFVQIGIHYSIIERNK
ncbi:MAG: porin family protein [Bacteroidia bacterium]